MLSFFPRDVLDEFWKLSRGVVGWCWVNFQCRGRGSGGAKVLGKLPVPGRPTNLDYSRAKSYCLCGRCGWGCLDILFSHLSLLVSFSSLFFLSLFRRRPDID